MSYSRWAAIAACLTVLSAGSAYAEPRDAGEHFEVSARGETYAELFQRALLPGPNGALVATNTAAPFHQYVFLRARDLSSKSGDGFEIELAAWGRGWIGPRVDEPLLDGDLQTANVRYRRGPFALRLGRQLIAGGAARYARFDGASGDAELGSGFSAQVYGGFTVLPRWDQRPGYAQLGASADTLLRDPAALPEPRRSDYFLAGARVAWTSTTSGASASVHEQHERGGLAHRNLGLDGYRRLSSAATLGANAVLDADREALSDARAWLDTRPLERLDVSLEYLHTEPALFLSHQSVLSVFGSRSYEEAGGLASVRATGWLTVDGSAFLDVYDGERPGGRGELALHVLADRNRRTLLRVGYTRLQAADNGYHSLRSSLSRQLLPRWTATFEAYAFLYDRAIRSYRASTVYASTLSFEPSRALSVLLGGSLASSPYASFDAQAQLRLAYNFDLPSQRQR